MNLDLFLDIKWLKFGGKGLIYFAKMWYLLTAIKTWKANLILKKKKKRVKI